MRRQYYRLKRYLQFLNSLSVKPVYFLIPAFFALLASLFEGISVGLLVPLAQSIISRDFESIQNIPVFSNLIKLIPFISLKQSYLFSFLIGVILIAAIFKNILQYGSVVSGAFVVRRFANNLRKLIFGRYLSFGKLFFDRNNTGQLHHILMAFTQEIAANLLELVHMLNSLFMMVVYLVIMFLISWKLSLITIFLFPVLHFSLEWIIKKVNIASEAYAQSQKALSEKIYNVLSCIPLVKSYACEADESKRFGEMSNSVECLQLNIDRKHKLIQPLQEIIMLLAFILLIIGMAFMMMTRAEHRSIGSFLIFFYVIRRASNCFGVVERMRSSMAVVRGALSSVAKIFDDKDKHFIPNGTVIFDGIKKNMMIENLNFAYDEKIPILKGMNLTIERGKMAAIVGPTGVGKIGRAHLMMRFYDSMPGEIKIDDIDIREFDLKSLRNKIAIVSQDVHLFNDTIRANLIYGLPREAGEAELVEVAKKARLYEFIEKLPLQFKSFVGDRGVRLSGGEKQRVSIARALLKHADILILDEATSALDTATEKLIQRAIEELICDRTTIVIAHRLSTIKNADKIVVMEGGAVAEEGTLEELLKRKEKFYRYWEEQKFY